MPKFLVYVPESVALSDDVILKSLQSSVEAKFSIHCQTTLLKQDEVIGNLKAFTEAVQAASEQSKPAVITNDNEKVPIKWFLDASEKKENLLGALYDAIARLDHFKNAIESKKLKRFVDKLKSVYENNA